MWMLLIGGAFAQQDYARLEGRWCDRYNKCKTYTMDLYPNGRMLDSLKRSGTYTLIANTAGRRVLRYQIGSLVSSVTEGGTDNCWAEPSPPVNPALGAINVCLGIQLQELTHYDDDCELDGNIDVVYPLEEEAGHWSAGRFTPGGGGMWVHELEYHLINQADFFQCSGLDHRVRVFLGDADAPPPDDPTVLYEFDVDGASIVAGSNSIEVPLPDPLLVGSDQSLFLAVEMVREADGDTICQFTCSDALPFVGDTSFWSNSTVAPYPWMDLNDFGIGELLVVARGIYAAP